MVNKKPIININNVLNILLFVIKTVATDKLTNVIETNKSSTVTLTFGQD